ncbi:MAG: hypothetical protein IJK28_01165 [Clostridia bacterium]|nr:hypothetical protein [Clostridia bacterium]
MKKQRFRFKILALVVFGLFALLAFYGGYSVLTYGDRWFASSHNGRVRQQKQTVAAGSILDRDGTVLASNAADGTRVYAENPAVRRAMVHVVGDRDGRVSNSVESFHASYLYGFRTSLWERVRLLLSGGERVGDTVRLTLSADLCTRLTSAFERHGVRTGAAVVMDWQTGEILAMVSLPSFDPMDAEAELPAGARYNRATQTLLNPGAAFAPVAAACGPLTPEALQAAAEAFGYNDNFLFSDLVVENSVYPTDRDAGMLAQRAAGTDGVRATPLHLCMTACAAANGGQMMTPRLILSVAAPDGKTRHTPLPTVYRTAFRAEQMDTVRACFTEDGLTGIASDTCYLGYLPDIGRPWAVCVAVWDGTDARIPAAVAEEALAQQNINSAGGSRNSADRGE